jgi:hypothetical protein
MSVIIVQQLAADPNELEQFASANQETFQSVLEAAKSHGVIAHRICGSEDGRKVLVLDEWPDRESFDSFAGEQASQIESMFEAAGVTEVSAPTVWRELTTHDAFGWGA